MNILTLSSNARIFNKVGKRKRARHIDSANSSKFIPYDSCTRTTNFPKKILKTYVLICPIFAIGRAATSH